MARHAFGLLEFEEAYFERIWGGRRLQSLFDKPLPPEVPIGEAWLISDHPQHESIVAEGPHAGKSLRTLLQDDAPAILGSRAELTVHGRFPLLLKLLDSQDYLSVQVHPDDETAKSLGEPDVGKTEMWHVLSAQADSELICGFNDTITEPEFSAAVENGMTLDCLRRFQAQNEMSVFVPAGTIHAIGPGIVLAEIQQNSDITYRLYDWERMGPDRKPRELHIQKALAATHFDSTHSGPVEKLQYEIEGGVVSVLSACRYFAAERIHAQGAGQRDIDGSFHLLLGVEGETEIECSNTAKVLAPGKALLVPGAANTYCFTGNSQFLDYYVPDLRNDIVIPLEKAGFAPESILALGGNPATSDLRAAI